jgi:hypothetical protein
MADFTVRADHIDVEQIMRQIRARIRDKRGADYTEEEIRELAAVKLEKFLDPRAVRSDLLQHYRRQHQPAPLILPEESHPPLYDFTPTTVYVSDRGAAGRILTIIRKIFKPITKLFFHVDTVWDVLSKQSVINAQHTRLFQRAHQRFITRDELDSLNFEMFNNLVVELTRLGIEVKNLRMQVESFGTRLDFDERRARALEGVVQYRPGAAVAKPAPVQQPQPGGGAAQPGSAGGAQGGVDEGDEEDGGAGGEGGDLSRSARRRRRRRGRRRGGQGGPMAGPGGAEGAGEGEAENDSEREAGHEPAQERAQASDRRQDSSWQPRRGASGAPSGASAARIGDGTASSGAASGSAGSSGAASSGASEDAWTHGGPEAPREQAHEQAHEEEPADTQASSGSPAASAAFETPYERAQEPPPAYEPAPRAAASAPAYESEPEARTPAAAPEPPVVPAEPAEPAEPARVFHRVFDRPKEAEPQTSAGHEDHTASEHPESSRHDDAARSDDREPSQS